MTKVEELVKSWVANTLSIDTMDEHGVLVRLSSDPDALTRIWYDTDQQREDMTKAQQEDATPES